MNLRICSESTDVYQRIEFKRTCYKYTSMFHTHTHTSTNPAFCVIGINIQHSMSSLFRNIRMSWVIFCLKPMLKSCNSHRDKRLSSLHRYQTLKVKFSSPHKNRSSTEFFRQVRRRNWWAPLHLHAAWWMAFCSERGWTDGMVCLLTDLFVTVFYRPPFVFNIMQTHCMLSSCGLHAFLWPKRIPMQLIAEIWFI